MTEAAIAVGQRRGRRALVIAAVLLVAAAAAAPAVWGWAVDAGIRRSLRHRHPHGAAVLAMHVGGEDGRRFDAYAVLWQAATLTRDQRRYRWFGHHHVAVLVADGREAYRYYWSLREHRLVLDARIGLDALGDRADAYRFTDADLDHDDGFAWHRSAPGYDWGLWYWEP